MTVFTSDEVRSQLSKYSVICLDRQYGQVKHSWLTNKYLPFWENWLFQLNAKWKSESWDCDKFARLFQSNLFISGFLSGSERTPLVGLLVTRNPSHATNLVKTEKGWYEIEPQDNKVTVFNRPAGDVQHIYF